MSQNALLNIPVDQLEENPVALRTVDPESIAFQQLKDSIADLGLLNPINVVPAVLPDGKTPKTTPDGRPVYRIMDGLHRTTACRMLNVTEVPAQVFNKTEVQTMVAQLAANAHRVETKPYQYSQHLIRILGSDATMTLTELAGLVHMSPEWLNKRLGLVNLHPDIGKLVDDGQVTITNAVELAKLRPIDEQLGFIEQAITDPPAVFTSAVKQKIKAIRDERRAGRDPNAPYEFKPVPHLRKLSEIKEELEAPAVVPALIQAAGITDPIEAANLAIKWAVQMDEASVKAAQAKDAARRKKAEEDKLKRQQERAAARAKAAEEALAANKDS